MPGDGEVVKLLRAFRLVRTARLSLEAVGDVHKHWSWLVARLNPSISRMSKLLDFKTIDTAHTRVFSTVSRVSNALVCIEQTAVH